MNSLRVEIVGTAALGNDGILPVVWSGYDPFYRNTGPGYDRLFPNKKRI